MTCNWSWSARLLVAVVALIGCDDSKTTTIDNTGSVCFIPNGDAVTVSVLVDACLQGVCRKLDRARCTASVSNGEVSISSHVEVVADPDNGPCPTSCAPARLSCDLAPPQQGEHVVSHGAEKASVTFPLVDPTLVFGSANACPDSDS